MAAPKAASRALISRLALAGGVLLDTGGDLMAKAFGFDEDELKMLLVAVRQMRRTFEAARKTAPEPQPAVDAYARLYDDLYEKLLEMAGPLPDTLEDVL